MITNQLITTGLGLAAGGGILYYLRSIPAFLYRKIKSRLIHSVKVYQYDELFDVLEKYMAKHYTAQYRDVEACLVQEASERVVNTLSYGMSVSTKPLTHSIRYKQETNTFTIKYKGKRLFISKSKEKLDHVQNVKDIYFSRFILSGWRAKDAI